jgi:ribosomal protein L34E
MIIVCTELEKERLVQIMVDSSICPLKEKDVCCPYPSLHCPDCVRQNLIFAIVEKEE